MIKNTSRYFGGYAGKVVSPRNNESTSYIYRRFNVESNTQYNLYQVVEGDRLDVLAYQLYGNSALWHKILDINPDIHDGWELVPGTMLRIPANV